MRRGVFFCFVLAAALATAVAGLAQTETATLSGRVTDPQGAVVPEAQVEVTNIDTNLKVSTTTNNEGLYVVPNLRPGRYRVSVRKDGFKEIVKTDIVLHVQDNVALNFSLEVGSLVQSVTVTGGAPLVDTESGTVSTLVDRQFVEDIPLNGRSFQTLISLTPGTVLTKTNFSEQGQFSINGQRANANYFTVDGVSANTGVSAGGPLVQSAGGSLPGFTADGGTNSLVSVDAMEEFRIQTSTFAPEFGRTPGGQVSIVTRTGANDFHGTLFEYFRNDVLDASNWFANQRGQPKAQDRQNDFGGVLGGPILKNQTFFFFSYEGLRLRLPRSQVTIVPSLVSRQTAPAQLQPFLNAYTIPNGATFANGFAESALSYSDPSSLDATSIRVDHTVASKLRLFGRYSYARSEREERGFNNSTLSSISDLKLNMQTLTLGGTLSISPNVSSDTRINYSRNKALNVFRLDDFGGAVPPPDSVLFPSSSPENSFLNFFLIGGRFLLVGKNARNVQRQFNLIENLSAIKGAHQLRFGVDYRRLSPINGANDYAQIPFFNGILGPGGVISGIPLFVVVAAQEQVTLLIQNFSAYGQDTWKITPRLTLTYGLRWEVNPAPSGREGNDLFTIQNLDNLTALTLAPQGTPLYKTTYNNFAPRVGLAYQLSQSRSRETVLRGGFGLFYDLGTGSLGNAPIFFPYGRTNTLVGVPFPLTPAQAAPPPFTLVPQGRIITSVPNLKLAYTYQWNMTLEQSLGSDQVISASYVGAVGRRLLRQELLLTPTFFQVAVTRNAATSDYHALQLQFQRRLSRGLQALASYTWSHSIDIASNDSAINAAAGFIDPRIDRGSSDFDVRHSFQGAIIYDIPTPSIGRGGKALFGDWSVDALIFARSATPVDLIGGTIFLPGGFFSTARPDLVPGVPLEIDDPTAPGGKRFNAAAFTGPAGQQGTLGRNVLRGFGAWQVDFALVRQFKLTERVNLQFRSEFFNIFNHPNFGDPVNDLVFDPNFGSSISMLGQSLGSGGVNGGFNPLYQIGGPRSIQFALKLTF